MLQENMKVSPVLSLFILTWLIYNNNTTTKYDNV